MLLILFIIFFIPYFIWCIITATKCGKEFDSSFMGFGCFVISLFLTPFAGKYFFKPQNTTWEEYRDTFGL